MKRSMRHGTRSSRRPSPRSHRRRSGDRKERSRHRPQRRTVRQRRRSKPAALLRLIAAAALVALAALALLLIWSFRPASSSKAEPIQFEVQSHDRWAVTDRLARRGLVDAPGVMKIYLTVLAPSVEFPRRSHLLRPGLSPRQLVQTLGEVGSRPTVRVTLPEGLDRFAIAERLDNAGVCAESAFLTATRSPKILSEFEIPGATAEGYLFPSTYEFHQDESPRRVVLRLVREANSRLEALLEEHGGIPSELQQLGFGTHELMILASIIEKETGQPEERAKVARVFLNRLKWPDAGTRGRLQSDPTAAYGCLTLGSAAPESCATFSGLPTGAMLRDEKNPYNTYRHTGLPPGPISNPGEAAMAAVLAPEESAALYFVADGQGRHTFSETYQEHMQAVDELRRKKEAVSGRGKKNTD